MTKRETDYIALLNARCDILRARVGDGRRRGSYVLEWQRELAALTWAIEKLENSRSTACAAIESSCPNNERSVKSGAY